jgi:hypothetical protein
MNIAAADAEITPTQLVAEDALFAPRYRTLSAEELKHRIERVRVALDVHGVAEIEGLFSDATVAEMRDYVQARYRAGEKAFAKEQLTDTVFARICRSTFVRQLGTALLEPFDFPAFEIGDDIWPGITIYESERKAHWNDMHFDFAPLTGLIPVLAAGSEFADRAPLLYYPNMKSLLPSTPEQWMTGVSKRLRVPERLGRPLKLHGKVGSMYLVWGCRTLHAVGSLSSGAVRSTCSVFIGEERRRARLMEKFWFKYGAAAKDYLAGG